MKHVIIRSEFIGQLSENDLNYIEDQLEKYLNISCYHDIMKHACIKLFGWSHIKNYNDITLFIPSVVSDTYAYLNCMLYIKIHSISDYNRRRLLSPSMGYQTIETIYAHTRLPVDGTPLIDGHIMSIDEMQTYLT